MYQLALGDKRAVEYCLEIVATGGVFAANLGRVYTLVGDAYSEKACERISGAKGHPEGYTTGWLSFDFVQRFYDAGQITPLTAFYLRDGEYLNTRLGGRVLIRYPVGKEGLSTLPPWMISNRGQTRHFQQFTFMGMSNAYEIEKACARAVAISHPNCPAPMAAARSANYHGLGSIVDLDEATEFCRSESIELVIHNESVGKGSYAIFTLGPDGNKLTRYDTCSESEIDHLTGSLPQVSLER